MAAVAMSHIMCINSIPGYRRLPSCVGTVKPRCVRCHSNGVVAPEMFVTDDHHQNGYLAARSPQQARSWARRCQRVGTTLSCYNPGCAYLSHRLASNEVLIGPSTPLSRSRCHLSGVSPEMSVTDDDQLGYSVAGSTQQIRADQQGSFKLISGAWYMPHPDKEKTGGEDAHFICEDQGIIGVADGVGGWAKYGIDAGEYARRLMSNAVSFIEKESLVDPAKILAAAHSVTRCQGSCTTCIIALTDQGIHAINLGDSGFVVIRDGSIAFRTRAQQHGFNFPYQLGSESECQPPSAGEILKFAVQPGDVIVAGTDGLFDNLSDNEIASIVVNAKREHLNPQETAKNITTLARESAQDKNRDTPFSTAAREAGYIFSGGKLDDITVVVSYVMSNQ